MDESTRCPRCGWLTTHYNKEELAAPATSHVTRRVLSFLAIWVIIAMPVGFLFIKKGSDLTMIVFAFITIALLTAGGIARDKRAISIGTVYHCTCDSCGNKWDIPGIQKYFLAKGQIEEAAKWSLENQSQEADKQRKR